MSWVANLLITPIFFIGFSGLLIPIFRKKLEDKKNFDLMKVEFLFFIIVIGNILTTLFYLVLKRYNILHFFHRNYIVIPLILSSLCFFGKYVKKNINIIKEEIKLESTSIWSVITFSILLQYYLNYWFSTPYPYYPLFQEIHFMKAAVELNRFAHLNLETANSYLPSRIIHLALMEVFPSVSILKIQWTLPLTSMALSALLNIILLKRFCFQSSRLLANALAITSLYTFSQYWGQSYYSYFCSLLLVLYLFSAKINKEENIKKTVISLFFVYLFFLLTRSYFLDKKASLAWIYILLIFFFLVSKEKMSQAVFSWTLVAGSFTFHRAAILFVPIAILFAVLKRVYDSKKRSRLVKENYSWMLCLSAFIFVITFGFLIFMAIDQKFDAFYFDYKEFMSFPVQIFAFLLRKKVTVDSALVEIGGGPYGAVLEWFRSFTPATAILFFSSIYVFLEKRSKGFYIKNEAFWLGTFLLGSVLTSGLFPATYRARGLVILALCMFISYNLNFLVQNKRVVKFVFFLCFSLVLLYSLFILGNHIDGFEYLREAFAFIFVFLLICIILFLLGGERLKPYSIIALLALEVFLIKIIFYKYSFGSNIQALNRISHYNKTSLDASSSLAEYAGANALFSDPYTTANLKILSGINGMYPHPNLANMDDKVALKVKKILQSFLNCDLQNLETRLKELFLTQAREAKSFFENQELDVISSLNKLSNHVIWAISPTTKKWLTCYEKETQCKNLFLYENTREWGEYSLSNIECHTKLKISTPHIHFYKLK